MASKRKEMNMQAQRKLARAIKYGTNIPTARINNTVRKINLDY